jgi:DNA-binding LacI/PurR family transcriptional regulator
VTITPITANAHTGYCTSQAIRNASGVKPPNAVISAPMAASTRSVARNPPRLTMLCATARFALGFDVRAMSNPTTEPGPPADSTSTMSSQIGAGPGSRRIAVQTATSAASTPSSSHERRIGCREAQAAAAGYTLVLGDTQESAERESAHADRLGSAVDGFVLISSRLPDDELRELRRRHPVVLFNRELEDFPSVVLDSVDGSRQVVEHLVALGHRRLAYLGGPASAWMDAERRRSLSADAARAGAEITRLGPFSPTLDGGAAAADVGLGSGATALVAFNDLLAIGILQRLERRGVDVPGRISVVGFDDIFGSDFCHPPLTTVTSPAEQAGRMLIDMLLGTCAPGRTVLPTPLHVRDSTGVAAGDPTARIPG